VARAALRRIAVAGLVLLIVGMSPGSADAAESRAIAGEYEVGLRAVGIEPHSSHPSGSKPYAVCPAPTAWRLTCMSTVVPEHLAASERTSPAGPKLEGGGELGGFAPADLHSAYGLAGKGGEGMTIAITIAYDYPTAESDLAVYRETYGLPPCPSANGCFARVNQKGEAGNYPSPNPDWAAEAALDLDMASAACPECKLLLVEANDNGLDTLPKAVKTAAQLGADVISNSWGAEEFPGETALDSSFHHPGIPVLFASGDSGYVGNYPAASPEVIAVGGTSLYRDDGARGWRESAWIGAGSGCSSYEPKPQWQTDSGCDMRTIADVAAVADPETPVSVYDTFGGYGGWLLFGGTSASAPFMAGVEARLGSDERSAGAALFWERGPAGELFDVGEGSNGHCESPFTYLCRAELGYDGPTGWGTPGGSRPGPPVVSAGDVADVTAGEATLVGAVSPNGSVTTYRFEYGPTAGYGTTVPIPDADVGSGTEPVDVEQPITGLSKGATYHYRLAATNELGTSYGGDHSFVASDWSFQEMPAGGTREELFGVSCPTDSFCDAIGANAVYFEGSFYNDAPVAQRWNGQEWLRESPPVLHVPAEGYSSRLEDVSCAAPDACVAVGTNYEIGLGYMPLGETWDGSGWSITPMPVPLDAAPRGNGQYELRMHGISCASPSFCVAVGEVFTDTSSEATQGVIETWDGSDWTARTLPGPPGWIVNLLWGVSCPSEDSCVAVGESRAGGGSKPLVARLDGVDWSREASPVPAGGLQGVSCGSESTCMAVGGTDGEFGGDGVAEEWDGTTWTALPLDQPMRGVSCVAADSCVAVGGENPPGGLPEAFGARWNGSEWTDEDPVLPADASDNAMELYDVDCSAGACTAVGWYWAWGYRPLAERLPLVSGPAAPGAFIKPALAATHEATLRATVFPKGLATTYQFEYGNSTSYGTSVPVPAAAIGSGSDGVNVDETISGLEPATTYHFRIVAISSAGTTRSADRTLVTLPESPVVVTNPGASDITAESATVTGFVNPNAAKVTNCHIEYGPAASYGKSAPCSPSSPGAGNEPVKVSAAIAGLSPGTAYHFRVVATNGGGTTYGGGQVFATAPGPLALGSGPSQVQEPGTVVGRVYRDCVARARGDYRRARKVAMRKRGSARSAALKRADRHKWKVLEQCIARVDALL
jgi:subtilase family protein